MTFPLPDPPMALHSEWVDWRDAALNWIERQEHPWTADDLREAMEPGRSNWPGSAIRTATARDMIRLTGRVQRSRVRSRKKSLLPEWKTL